MERSEARAKGLLHYTTGRPCKRGHFAKRVTTTGGCTACVAGWRHRNPESWSEQRKKYRSKPEVRLRQRLVERAYHTIKQAGLAKFTRHSKLFGAPVKQVRAHIEAQFLPGMTWDNWGYGPDKWHIDHIKPVSSFDLSVPGEIEKAFHYTNLQPLWQADNFAKGAKYDPD